MTSSIGGHKVVSIACGQLTSMALLDDGEVNKLRLKHITKVVY